MTSCPVKASRSSRSRGIARRRRRVSSRWTHPAHQDLPAVGRGFTPKQMARIDDDIIANARRIVDDIADKGEVDFVNEVAALVPMHNICDMVGIPEQHRRTIADETQFADGGATRGC